MGKKLFVGNYTFDSATNSITVHDNILPERLLIITDVTLNKFLYNFADPTLGYVDRSYSSFTNTTTFTLAADCVALGCEDTDSLQIFIEKDHAEVEFSETFIDPVSKIRVSNPENLIDTDFEYGTQSSKWETLQTVNNVPTIYSTSGDIPIQGVTSVTSTQGSKQIKVTTNTGHGLVLGDPINVQGLTEYLAEGYFLVSGVSDSRNFFYEMDQELNRTEELSGSYTTIIPSKFFEGSNVILNESSGEPIVSDGSSPSTLTVTSEFTHGFEENTKMYLRNTVGPKDLIIADQTATAADGRPVVDTESRLETNFSIDSTVTTGRGGAAEFPVASFDWESTYVQYFDGSEVDTVTDQITWTTHGMQDNFCLLCSYPIQDETIGGLEDGVVYYVKVVDDDTIQLCTDYGTLANVVNITANPGSNRGYFALNLVYKVETKDGTQRHTAYYDRNLIQVNTQYNRARSGTSSYSYAMLICTTTQVAVPESCIIYRIYYSGDLNSSSEYIDMTYYSQSYNGLSGSNLTFRIGRQGRRSGNYYPNTDITRCLYQSGSNWYANANYNPTGSVGGTWYVYHYFTVTGANQNPDVDHSGSDLIDNEWGLGTIQPSRIVAFQNRRPGQTFTSSDAFSNLSNQREKARYANMNLVYNYASTAGTNDGRFTLNYNDSGKTNLGSTSEIFYVFANINSAYRNTIYKQAHGLSDGDTVELSVTNYDEPTNESFRFASGTGDIEAHQETVSGTVSKVSDDEFRVQATASPFTDDIVVFPSAFTVTKSEPNPTFNTVFIPNHKVVSSATATYSNDSGTVIGGLTDATDYLLTRYNDSRLFVASTTVTAAASALTGIIGNNSSVATNFDVDIETPLGLVDPSTATITKVEFRGDFNQRDEFVTLTFEDGYIFDVGVNGARSSQWQEETNWSPKDISSVLKDIGGGIIGFTVEADPTSTVVDGNGFPQGGMTYEWEIRFTVTGQAGSIVLSSAGTGQSTFAAQSITGAYDGIYTVDTTPSSNQMTLTTDFKIPDRVYGFTDAEVDDVAETIQLQATGHHNLITGEKVTYAAISPASDLFDTTEHPDVYVIVIDNTTIAFATSYLDAINGAKIPLTNQVGSHQISTLNVVKSIQGGGTVTINTNGLDTVVGNGTSFLSEFKRFDEFWVICNGFMQKFEVEKVLTDELMELTTEVPTTVTAGDYYFITQAIPRPDGFSLHKPFDGGIDITAGTSPNCKVTRQTRKYFRYQSGKGIQNSFAINFSPTRIVDSITNSGTTMTVTTQEIHNLSAGEQIEIYEAEVETGENPYNGIYEVATIESPYSFTYEVLDSPVQKKASGIPSYARKGWRDSFVRAGMFDDQNGFFYEYDGTDLYAVRRSSTLQLSGYVNTTQHSQVVTGVSTSFSTQLNFGNNVVIRGQTYKVVEVGSDNRIVIQPAYRGVSATNVKITKTIDTKVAQRDWSIDPCDGSGTHGFVLDINKIQMAYADYSWYGAGKIRFGFKDQNGHVKYVHEFVHNNRLLESYFRSGNLPGRYEIENGVNPNTAPTLFHFGTSVIMDGTFDDDKAYLFSSSSNPFAFTNGASTTVTSTGNTTFEQITLNNSRVFVYAIPVSEQDASSTTVGSLIRDPSNTNIPEGTYVAQVIVNGASSKIYASYPGTAGDPDDATINSGTVFTLGETTLIDLTRPIPLVSLRLAPSVDSGVTGAVGERDIINRMQLTLRRAGITTNQDLEAFVILNGLPSNLDFEKVQSPSLSEIIRHDAGDLIQQGTVVYSTKVSVGSLDIELGELIDMGNSILGGDSIFPSGPDLITIAIQPQDTSTISGTSPLFVSGKITWTESQA